MIKNETDLANFALQQLSIGPIGSMDDDSRVAVVIKDTFQLSKESILKDFIFDWAHKAEKIISYPDGGYQKPADCIKIIGLGTDCQFCCCSSGFKNLTNFSHKFSVREINGRLYIDSCCSNYDTLHYVYNNINYNSLPTDLYELIGYRLAADACLALTGDLQRTQFLRGEISRLTSEVRKHEGLEHQPVKRKGFNGYAFGNPSKWF